MEQYTTQDGLKTDRIFDILVDSKGYLWVGDEPGVSRYDGTEFVRVDSNSTVAYHTVLKMIEAPNGDILFGSAFSCFFRYDGEVFHKLRYEESDRYFIGKYSRINSLVLDSNDVLHIGNESGEGLVSVDSDCAIEFKTTQAPLILKEISETVIFANTISTDSLNALTDLPLQLNLGQLDTVLHLPRLDHEPTTYSFLFEALKDGRYVLAVNNRVFIIQPNGTFTIKDFPSVLSCLHEDSKGRIWVGLSRNQVICFNEAFEPLPYQFPQLKERIVTDIEEDHQGGFWFSTMNQGLFYCPNLVFRSLETHEASTEAYHLSQGPDSTLFALGSNCKVLQVDTNSQIIDTWQLNVTKDVFTANWLTYLPSAKTLWVGHNECPMGIYLPTREVHSLRKATGYFPFDFAINPDSVLYMFSRSGILSTDLKHPEEPLKITQGNRIFNRTVKGLNDRYWFLGDGGLWYMENDSFQVAFPKEVGYRTALFDLAMVNDEIWVAGMEAGLKARVNGKHVLIGEQWGIPKKGLLTLCQQNDSTVWIGTTDGLYRLRITSTGYQSRYFGKKQGLNAKSITRMVKSGNYMWLKTTDTPILFSPNDIADETSHAPLYITQVNIQDSVITASPELHLAYDQNLLRFHFRHLDFQQLGEPNYRYRMKGVIDQWQPTKHPEAILSNIPPGAYHFEVSAQNSEGIWGPSSQMSISIAPAVWQTWWFQLLLAFAVLGLISLVFRVLLHRLQRETRLKEQASYFQQQALSAQMNPHFIFNALNSIQGFLVRNDRIGSIRHMVKFSELIRSMLEASQRQFITVEEEAELLEHYCSLESLRFKAPFQFSIEVDDPEGLNQFLLPSYLIQPHVENAIWHGISHLPEPELGAITIRISRTKTAIQCTVEDNGVGREQSAKLSSRIPKHTSSGLNMSHQRMQLFGQRLKAQSFSLSISDRMDQEGRTCGTQVRIEAPLLDASTQL